MRQVFAPKNVFTARSSAWYLGQCKLDGPANEKQDAMSPLRLTSNTTMPRHKSHCTIGSPGSAPTLRPTLFLLPATLFPAHNLHRRIAKCFNLPGFFLQSPTFETFQKPQDSGRPAQSTISPEFHASEVLEGELGLHSSVGEKEALWIVTQFFLTPRRI